MSLLALHMDHIFQKPPVLLLELIVPRCKKRILRSATSDLTKKAVSLNPTLKAISYISLSVRSSPFKTTPAGFPLLGSLLNAS